MPEKPIILSGIQPTGHPTLGNYLGAISNWVALQEQAHAANELALFMVVDLHALTMPQNPEKLRQERKDMAVTLLACGLDPNKCILFEQSKVPQHSELAWLLNCMTPVSWLARMTQWKSKLKISVENDSVADAVATEKLCLGLFAYPVLMAADVLLYRAAKIPVGEDQIQHLELARDVATTFNKTVKAKFFPMPKPIITQTKRVMSLRDPFSKMSKSDPSDQSRINMVDPPSLIAQKIKRAVTDSTMGITYDPENRPAIANLLRIYAAMKNTTAEAIALEHAQSSAAQFKEGLADAVISHLTPIQQEMARIQADPGYVEKVLEEGAQKAREIAHPNLMEVHRLLGLR
ncbi:Tryptophan--tRNA ligase, mitochondrial [Actinomortierella wolfii]|nr:Tryptophan--tRNA ligase, mitochondrial [Actinomortierella wolfii]